MSYDVFSGTALAKGKPLAGFDQNFLNMMNASVNPYAAVGEAAGGLLMDLANFGYGIYQDQRNFKYQKALNEQQQANYEQQFQFQQDVWNQTKEREDTAIQRRVKDMQAAGLNPVAATGANASSVGTVATPSFSSPHSNPVMMRNTAFENAMQAAQFKAQLNMQSSQIQLANAEAELKRAQARTEYFRPELIKAETQSFIASAGLTAEKIESMNYQQVEEKIIAEFMEQFPELKQEQIKEQLAAIGIDNDYKKAQTAKAKADIVYDGVKTLFYSIGQVLGIASFGSLGSVHNPIGFMK